MTLLEFLQHAPFSKLEILRENAPPGLRVAHVTISREPIDPEYAAALVDAKTRSECVGAARTFTVVAYGESPRVIEIAVPEQPAPPDLPAPEPTPEPETPQEEIAP